ncbi:MAG TPA: SulP family inorganic anion transporter [Acidimicrobiales bacterium]|nr:SulP family inorganic anion transporter [Acidimicrobiales bacterium]
MIGLLRRLGRPSFGHDTMAGFVLGMQSVPSGLATGLLAGLNPLTGLYGYLVGTVSGALTTSSRFMAVQGTSAMAVLLVDVGVVHNSPHLGRALATLVLLTGAVMILAGVLRLGSLLRFVSNAVMVGFINAVGLTIMIGQLANFTGYAAHGANRVSQTADTVLHPGRLEPRTVVIGLATVALIVLLERTPLRGLGLVVAVAISSAAVPLLGWVQVATMSDLGVALGGLPGFELPLLRLAPVLIVPAVSIAFVGLIQGAGVAAAFPNPDGHIGDASGDFLGQGTSNVAVGLLGGMPVGGSMSASALNKSAGARSRWSFVFASVVMLAVLLVLSDVIGRVAMPALAGLLMVVGFRTISLGDLRSVWRTGPAQKIVMGVTFALTVVIPLQYAVLTGVALSVLLYVVNQSNQVVIRRRVRDEHGNLMEVDPPTMVPAHEVLTLQPYGSLFFAAAPVFEAALPAIDSASHGSVVLLRLRGRSDLGVTFIEVLRRYSHALQQVGSRLMIVSVGEKVLAELAATGGIDDIGDLSIYRERARVGSATERAQAEARAWVDARRDC